MSALQKICLCFISIIFHFRQCQLSGVIDTQWETPLNRTIRLLSYFHHKTKGSSATRSEDCTNTLQLSPSMQKETNHISIQIILEQFAHLDIPKNIPKATICRIWLTTISKAIILWSASNQPWSSLSTLPWSQVLFLEDLPRDRIMFCKILLACTPCCLEVVKMMMHHESLVGVTSVSEYHLFCPLLAMQCGMSGYKPHSPQGHHPRVLAAPTMRFHFAGRLWREITWWKPAVELWLQSWVQTLLLDFQDGLICSVPMATNVGTYWCCW